MSTGPRRTIAILAVIVGLVWTGQGIGLIGGSFMTGETVWALIGPVVAVVGILVILRTRRGDG